MFRQSISARRPLSRQTRARLLTMRCRSTTSQPRERRCTRSAIDFETCTWRFASLVRAQSSNAAAPCFPPHHCAPATHPRLTAAPERFWLAQTEAYAIRREGAVGTLYPRHVGSFAPVVVREGAQRPCSINGRWRKASRQKTNGKRWVLVSCVTQSPKLLRTP